MEKVGNRNPGAGPRMYPSALLLRAPSPLCKVPASSTSAVMLLWPWVRPGPWCLKMSPASVLSPFGTGRTSLPRVGPDVCVGRFDAY